MIVFGSNSQGLAEKISKQTQIPIAKILLKRFPDGESYVLVDENVGGKEVFLVQSMYPNQNDALVELLLISDALKNLRAKKITAIIPYLAYARQDKPSQLGEPHSLKVVVELLKDAGISKVITVDTHFHKKVESFRFLDLGFENVSAGRLLLDDIRKTTGLDTLVVGPDSGSSELINYTTGKKIFLEKEEICPTCKNSRTKCKCEESVKKYEVSGFKGDIDFSGKNVVILDDMITSGTTMIKAVEKIREEGANKVIVATTHGLFLKDSLKILKEKTDYLVTTDSIETPFSKVSIAPLIAGVLR